MKRKSFGAAAPFLLLFVVAGCGSASPSAGPIDAKPQATTPPTLAPATPAASPTPAPTLTVNGGDTAAVVNGVKIPMTTFKSLLALDQRQRTGQPGVTPQSLAKDTMTAVIADELVRQYASSHGLSVSNAALNARIQQDEKNFRGKAGLVKKLTSFGLTFDAYVTLVRASIQRHLVAAKVSPLLASHVRHILIATTRHKPPRPDAAAKALAQQVLSKIKHGTSFASLARRYSDDPGSGKQGGDLGTFCTGLGKMVPEFDRASASLPLNHPTLVHTVYGYHIVEVLGRAPAKPGQCADPTAPPGTPDPQPENTLAFQTWVKNQLNHASIQRIAKVS